MPKDFSRTERIGDQMQRELAMLIQREVKDPRVSMVTVNAVKVSRDLGRVVDDRAGTPRAVGHPGGIANIDKIFVGEVLLDGVDDGEAADA